jgi:small ligand-binding sensory domain FIST
VAGALTDSFRALTGRSAALVFLGGRLAERIEDVASGLAKAELGIPVLLASGAGVLSERGEIEGEPAAAGLVMRGGSPTAVVAKAGTLDDATTLLAARLAEDGRQGNATTLVFAQADGFGVDSLEPLAAIRAGNVVGAGTPGNAPVVAVTADGTVQVGNVGALSMRGLTPAHVRASPACRLLMPLRPITAASGNMLEEIGGEPALDVLKGAAAGITGQPLVLTVLAPETTPPDAARAELVLRGIQGVDPARRSILLSGELKVGWRAAFAVRDPASARADLELCTRELARETAGAAPRFGVYVSCAGRGSSLYGAPDIDLRVLRGKFPDVPFVGLHSAFEIAPFEGRPSMHFYTGVVALFTQPS